MDQFSDCYSFPVMRPQDLKYDSGNRNNPGKANIYQAVYATPIIGFLHNKSFNTTTISIGSIIVSILGNCGQKSLRTYFAEYQS